MAALPPGGAQICHKGALLECQLRGPMLLRKQCLPKVLNERATRAMGRWRLSVCVWWEAKFNLFDCIVEYSENMLVLRGKAGMSERSERLVGGQIQPFFNYNPAKGG